MAAVDVPKEMLDKVYEAIEVAKTTGKIRKGSNEVTKSLEKGKVRFVVIAKDVSPPEIIMHLPLLCEEKGVLCVSVPSKVELGTAAGVPVGSSAIAIVSDGEAKGLVSEILGKLSK